MTDQGEDSGSGGPGGGEATSRHSQPLGYHSINFFPSWCCYLHSWTQITVIGQKWLSPTSLGILLQACPIMYHPPGVGACLEAGQASSHSPAPYLSIYPHVFPKDFICEFIYFGSTFGLFLSYGKVNLLATKGLLRIKQLKLVVLDTLKFNVAP